MGSKVSDAVAGLLSQELSILFASLVFYILKSGAGRDIIKRSLLNVSFKINLTFLNNLC